MSVELVELGLGWFDSFNGSIRDSSLYLLLPFPQMLSMFRYEIQIRITPNALYLKNYVKAACTSYWIFHSLVYTVHLMLTIYWFIFINSNTHPETDFHPIIPMTIFNIIPVLNGVYKGEKRSIDFKRCSAHAHPIIFRLNSRKSLINKKVFNSYK